MMQQQKNKSPLRRHPGRIHFQDPELKAASLVIGVGNRIHGDDGVGPWIARQLKTTSLPNTRIEIRTGEAAALIESWKATDSVILIDAVNSGPGAQPGKIYRIDALRQMIPDRFAGPSSHHLGVALAVELARVLDRLPRHLIVYGVEGQCFDFGRALTPVVRAAADRVIGRVIAEIAGFQV